MVNNDPVTRLTRRMIDPSVARSMQKGKIVSAEEAVDPLTQGRLSRAGQGMASAR